MSGTTTNYGLYLYGGGSDGLYPPDEIQDVKRLNENFKSIDTELFAKKGGKRYATVTAMNAGTGDFIGQLATNGSDDITYRWTRIAVGSSTIKWVPWDSDWMFSAFGVAGLQGGENANPGWGRSGGQHRYVSGQVQYQGGFYILGGTSTSNLAVGLPINAQTATGKLALGRIHAKNASDNYRDWELMVGLNNSTFNLLAIGGSAWRGAWDGTYPNAPFNEAWAQSDTVEWDFLYDPVW